MSGYPNFLVNPDMSGYIDASDFFDKPLSEQIEVNLSPEFSIGMDRVIDSKTGQNDYFKFEVTNNSNTNVQLCFSIVPKGKASDIESGEYGEFIDKFLYESALWNYVHECTYYRIASKIDNDFWFVGKHINYYIERNIGNCFWVYLSPGENYEDFVYWENVRIYPNNEYDFVVSAVKLPESCDNATCAMLSEQYFVDNIDEEVSWYNFYYNVEFDESISLYTPVVRDKPIESYYIDSLYRVTFSVADIPKYSPVIKGGNAKMSGGWNDTKNQFNNPYYKENLVTGEIEAVSNWSEYGGALSDVNVDISNVSLSDVSNLMSYSQNYFNLLKRVLYIFPPWVWITLCFGFTGLIVIGIIKAIL